MKIPGKIIQLTATPESDGEWSQLYVLTDEGRLYSTTLRVPDDQLEWCEVSRELEENNR